MSSPGVGRSGSKPKGRGRVVVIVLSSVLTLVIGTIVALIIIPPKDPQCVFMQSTSDLAANKNQSAVILAPTSNFVSLESVVLRAKASVLETLGYNLGDDEINDARGRELSIIVADGNPTLVLHSSVSSHADAAPDIRREIEETNYNKLNKVISCAVGELKQDGDQVETKAETDMLRALAIASSQLSTSGQKDLFVLGNGIQTIGAIHMQEKGSFPTSGALAKKLARSLYLHGDIPSLNGVTIHWYGLGQVDGVNQPSLPLSSSNGLRSFWTEVAHLAGATLPDVCAECGSGKPSESAIQVSAVKAPPCNLIVELYENDGVEFEPDSDVFRSEDQARAAARSTVAKFKAKECASMTVTGYAAAAKDKKAYLADKENVDSKNDELTKRRATGFAVLLKSAGFDGQIKTVGGGTCGTEWDANGKVDKKQQRLCRRVEVIN